MLWSRETAIITNVTRILEQKKTQSTKNTNEPKSSRVVINFRVTVLKTLFFTLTPQSLYQTMNHFLILSAIVHRTCYAANPRPDALMKEQLVEMTGLSPRVIRVWFQNKRCKDKKKTMQLKMQMQQEKVRLRVGWHLVKWVAHSHRNINNAALKIESKIKALFWLRFYFIQIRQI